MNSSGRAATVCRIGVYISIKSDSEIGPGFAAVERQGESVICSQTACKNRHGGLRFERTIMQSDRLTDDLFHAICAIPLIDPHSHIEPARPVARSLDDILGYHYYTELAHSAGMSKHVLQPQSPPRERVRAILEYLDRFDNTVQYSWFLEIARSFLGYSGDRISAADCDALCDAADRVFNQSDWEAQVFQKSNLEKIFLTNEFDDPLQGFDTSRYIPCLRTDALVFQLDDPAIRERLERATGIDVDDLPTLRKALQRLFEHFKSKGAKACAISLPPQFQPFAPSSPAGRMEGTDHRTRWASQSFWLLAECCREFKLPFDLMIGVNRNVYRDGVHQGRDLFDQRCSLIQYQELFNAFPEVTFCISVLSSGLNQELVSHAWIFPNVVSSGHWWYSNVPAYIGADLRARLEAVPKTKQLGFYSDAYKLEFVLPKYNMYRRALAVVLANDFVRPGRLNEDRAVELARYLLRENVQRIFNV
jgi:glucuronate isomerase